MCTFSVKTTKIEINKIHPKATNRFYKRTKMKLLNLEKKRKDGENGGGQRRERDWIG
jgi:hypothetical protein